MEKRELGEGGARILLEETLEGEELSFIILTDGERFAALAPTRDHKRVFDGNAGPNTGGMGAYSSDELSAGATCGTRLCRKLWSRLCMGWRRTGFATRDFCISG